MTVQMKDLLFYFITPQGGRLFPGWFPLKVTYSACNTCQSSPVYIDTLHHKHCTLLRYGNYMCGCSWGPSSLIGKLNRMEKQWTKKEKQKLQNECSCSMVIANNEKCVGYFQAWILRAHIEQNWCSHFFDVFIIILIRNLFGRNRPFGPLWLHQSWYQYNSAHLPACYISPFPVRLCVDLNAS